MAALPKSKERVLMSEGEHVLKCTGAEIKRIESAYPDGKKDDGRADVLVLSFVSETVDEDGMPEEMDILLPPAISSKNKTGRIAVMMQPGLDPANDDWDPDDMVGRKFSGYIVHEKNKCGNLRANAAKLKPFKGNGKAEPKAAAEQKDPFADE
jgi:hypothetical protein